MIGIWPDWKAIRAAAIPEQGARQRLAGLTSAHSIDGLQQDLGASRGTC